VTAMVTTSTDCALGNQIDCYYEIDYGFCDETDWVATRRNTIH